MAGNPVHIHLKENAVPYHVSVARQIPLQFQEQANKTIQQLLDSKIVAKVRHSQCMVFAWILCSER